MQQRVWLGLVFILTCLFCGSAVRAQPQIILPMGVSVWQRAEFRVLGVPTAANPFDPEVIRLDATFTPPSLKTITVPGFWYQNYQRALVSGRETLTPLGNPEWRVRFAGVEPGVYGLSVSIYTNGQAYTSITTNFSVLAAQSAVPAGYLRVAPGKQYFETSLGKPVPLVGENVCWHHQRGTYDYDDWFSGMKAAGENYARLWMAPWAFGIEAEPNTRARYRLDRAWQLDYVFNAAEQRGMYLLLCFDYHGMFETVPDYWGGNNNWTNNPYNSIHGGPCSNPNAFFTNSTAQAVYQKRLRYLVGRYGYSTSLAAWQFFNEIDNVYSHLVPTDVAAWHGRLGAWLHANDPFAHLVTTSMTGNSDRPEVWSLPQLDFACYHSYGEPGPANRIASVTQDFLKRYRKPVLVDEFGTDFRGWNRTGNDPYLRGFRQALWAGVAGGSVGCSMSWWWENIHSENVYPYYSALRQITSHTGWGRGTWTNINFRTSGMPPATVDALVPGGMPFNVTLSPNGAWGGKPSGSLAVANPSAADYPSLVLNSFVHGSAHQELRAPFRLHAWLTNNARLVMHLNSVSSGASLVVKTNGTQHYRTNLPNLDGGWNVNNEYNMDINVSLPAGKHLIDISNAGSDWFYLDWVRLEQALPATYTGNWQPSPASIGLRGARESLVYVVAPGASFPAGATNNNLLVLKGQSVTLTNWSRGIYIADWYNPSTGVRVGRTQSTATNSVLTLPLPDFAEDLAGVIYPPPSLTALGVNPGGDFEVQLHSEAGGRYTLQQSSDFGSWADLQSITNGDGSSVLIAPFDSNTSARFFRVEQSR
jgi:hypothetical protein